MSILILAFNGVELHRWKMAIASIIAIFFIDLYIFRALLSAVKEKSRFLKIVVYGAHWLVSFSMMAAALWFRLADPLNHYSVAREWITGIALVLYTSKLIAGAVIFIHDVSRISAWLKSFLKSKPEQESEPVSEPAPIHPDAPTISRSEFLMKTALVAGAVPLSLFSFGILSGAHDYRVLKRTILLPNLPKAFDGIRIGQISDIHAGTLYNKKAVRGGIDLLLNEKTDLIFFTGDMVNYYVREIYQYAWLFAKLKAPLGVYSVTGNHDYGDYNWWPNEDAKRNEFQEMINAHCAIGYDLLLNENRILKVDNESLAVIGVENWSLKRDKRYGKLDLAVKGTEDVPVKLLLSHDPTHWDAEVRVNHPEINVTFSGHTHGGQCGVEIGDARWSPSQYRFKQWADLYQEQNQFLYVNRGFGCLGYPGRIGMPPEITVIELKKA